MISPTALELLSLAQAQRRSGDIEAARITVERAVALEPRNLDALLARADDLAEIGDSRAAVSFYSAAIRQSAAQTLDTTHEAAIRRARTLVTQYARQFEEHIRRELARQGLEGEALPPRFARALDILTGKKRAYHQAPRHLFFPELAPIQFFERSAFPFLDEVEGALDSIRTELEQVIAQASDFEPYVKAPANRPPNSQRGLANNTAWSACFLIKDGAVTAGGAKCTRTIAALEKAPLARIPNHSPLVLFSKLAAGARIPPHTGMINTRLICHLPLIVPGDCRFRVGNEVRAWEEGKAWVFDDTIEHEAWNDSSSDRTILLFDIWRPDISIEEREAFTALCVAVDKFSGLKEWDH